MEATTVAAPPPPAKRVLTEEQLEKLKRARELALQKRRELAAQRAVEREALVQEKVKAKQLRDHQKAEKEAEERVLATRRDKMGEVESVENTSETPAVVVKKKVKRETVVVETSDRGEDEGVIDNARVFVVKRGRQPAENVVQKPPAPVPTPAQPDPHAAMFEAMFGAC